MAELTEPRGKQQMNEEKLNEALFALMRLPAQQAVREDFAKLNNTPASG